VVRGRRSGRSDQVETAARSNPGRGLGPAPGRLRHSRRRQGLGHGSQDQEDQGEPGAGRSNPPGRNATTAPTIRRQDLGHSDQVETAAKPNPGRGPAPGRLRHSRRRQGLGLGGQDQEDQGEPGRALGTAARIRRTRANSAPAARTRRGATPPRRRRSTGRRGRHHQVETAAKSNPGRGPGPAPGRLRRSRRRQGLGLGGQDQEDQGEPGRALGTVGRTRRTRASPAGPWVRWAGPGGPGRARQGLGYGGQDQEDQGEPGAGRSNPPGRNATTVPTIRRPTRASSPGGDGRQVGPGARSWSCSWEVAPQSAPAGPWARWAGPGRARQGLRYGGQDQEDQGEPGAGRSNPPGRNATTAPTIRRPTRASSPGGDGRQAEPGALAFPGKRQGAKLPQTDLREIPRSVSETGEKEIPEAETARRKSSSAASAFPIFSSRRCSLAARSVRGNPSW